VLVFVVPFDMLVPVLAPFVVLLDFVILAGYSVTRVVPSLSTSEIGWMEGALVMCDWGGGIWSCGFSRRGPGIVLLLLLLLFSSLVLGFRRFCDPFDLKEL
jgi:hypothetical protein